MGQGRQGLGESDDSKSSEGGLGLGTGAQLKATNPESL